MNDSYIRISDISTKLYLKDGVDAGDVEHKLIEIFSAKDAVTIRRKSPMFVIHADNGAVLAEYSAESNIVHLGGRAVLDAGLFIDDIESVRVFVELEYGHVFMLCDVLFDLFAEYCVDSVYRIPDGYSIEGDCHWCYIKHGAVDPKVWCEFRFDRLDIGLITCALDRCERIVKDVNEDVKRGEGHGRGTKTESV